MGVREVEKGGLFVPRSDAEGRKKGNNSGSLEGIRVFRRQSLDGLLGRFLLRNVLKCGCKPHTATRNILPANNSLREAMVASKRLEGIYDAMVCIFR